MAMGCVCLGWATMREVKNKREERPHDDGSCGELSGRRAAGRAIFISSCGVCGCI